MTEREIVRSAAEDGGLIPPGGKLEAAIRAQDSEVDAFTLAFIRKLLPLRGVRIERKHYLTSELRRRGVTEEVIARAVADRPAAAGVSPRILDAIARESIVFETKKSATLAFTMGLPGGFAMIGTVPTDVTQFYAHAFRIMQKISYLYGWQSFLDDLSEVDDETLGKLAALLGVMLGVRGASAAVTGFANNVVRPALQKQIANKALTKTFYYPITKQLMKRIGVELNKQIFARTVTKVVPLLGGVVSGGLTFASLKIGSMRLMQHLSTLPPALPG